MRNREGSCWDLVEGLGNLCFFVLFLNWVQNEILGTDNPSEEAAKIERRITAEKNKKKKIQRPGIEPGTLSVLSSRSNQLIYRC